MRVYTNSCAGIGWKFFPKRRFSTAFCLHVRKQLAVFWEEKKKQQQAYGVRRLCVLLLLFFLIHFNSANEWRGKIPALEMLHYCLFVCLLAKPHTGALSELWGVCVCALCLSLPPQSTEKRDGIKCGAEWKRVHFRVDSLLPLIARSLFLFVLQRAFFPPEVVMPLSFYSETLCGAISRWGSTNTHTHSGV